ncbi:hypothetical protein GJAV_G00132520 [Gymnothorax javanicus]|nr:hypothetical protein GJAV_G00132520 [Gymnothorax javanicus]
MWGLPRVESIFLKRARPFTLCCGSAELRRVCNIRGEGASMSLCVPQDLGMGGLCPTGLNVKQEEGPGEVSPQPLHSLFYTLTTPQGSHILYLH